MTERIVSMHAAHRSGKEVIPRAVNNIVDGVPYLRKLPWIGKKKVAVLGFCMGGGLALYALAQSKAFAAGVIYYQSMFRDPEDLKGIAAPCCATSAPTIRGRRRPRSICSATPSIDLKRNMRLKCMKARAMLS